MSEQSEFPIIKKKRALSGEVLGKHESKFEELGKWIMQGYSSGLVTVVDSTAKAVGVGGNDERVD